MLTVDKPRSDKPLSFWRAGLSGRVDPRELEQEYGVDVTTAEGARRLRRQTSGEYKREMRPGRYVHAVWQEMGVSPLSWARPDGRLVGVGHNCIRPREWAEQFAGFYDYWRAAVERPALIGSSYNPLPRDVFAAWRAGISPDIVPRDADLASRYVDAKGTGCPRLRPGALKDWPKIKRLGHAAQLSLGRACPGDRKRLLRLPTASLNAVLSATAYTYGAAAKLYEYDATVTAQGCSRVRWDEMARLIKRTSELPLETMQAAGVQASRWWKWNKLNQEQRDTLSIMAALTKADPRLRFYVASHSRRLVRQGQLPGLYVVGAWRSALKRGWVQTYVGPMVALLNEATDPSDPYQSEQHDMEISGVFGALAAIPPGVVPPQGALAYPSALVEWVESQGYGDGNTDFWSSSTLPSSAESVAKEAEAAEAVLAQHRLCRVRDRYAQRDPDWAIIRWDTDYRRGKSLAPVLKPVLEFLKKKAESGACLFIHGRDAEIIRDVLAREGYTTQYGITSRTLTTHCKRPPVDFMDYLKRMAGSKGTVVHVDTGFGGSIPAWMEKQGLPVSEVCLVSSPHPEKRIPGAIEAAGGEDQLRSLVLTELEHVGHRLYKPHQWCAGARIYSDAAPAYWARVYGVCDALGVPRTLPKGRKLRALKKRLKAAQKAGGGMSGLACLRGWGVGRCRVG